MCMADRPPDVVRPEMLLVADRSFTLGEDTWTPR